MANHIEEAKRYAEELARKIRAKPTVELVAEALAEREAQKQPEEATAAGQAEATQPPRPTLSILDLIMAERGIVLPKPRREEKVAEAGQAQAKAAAREEAAGKPREAQKQPEEATAAGQRRERSEPRRGETRGGGGEREESRQLTLLDILRRQRGRRAGGRAEKKQPQPGAAPQPPAAQPEEGMVTLYAVFMRLPSRSMFAGLKSETARRAASIVEAVRTSAYRPLQRLGLFSLGGKLHATLSREAAEEYARTVEEMLRRVFESEEVRKALQEKLGTPVNAEALLAAYRPRVAPIMMPAELALELIRDYYREKLEALQRLREEAERTEGRARRNRMSRIRALEEYIRRLEEQIEQIERATRRTAAQTAPTRSHEAAKVPA